MWRREDGWALLGKGLWRGTWPTGWQMGRRPAASMNCVSVLRAGTVDLNDAEISAYFHDVSVAIQDAREKTQAVEEGGVRRTATMLFCESMDDEDGASTTDGELHTRHRRRSVSTHREKQRTRSKQQDEHEERTKGKQGRAHITTTSSKISGMADRNPK